jgi:hypothetical protein
VDNRIEQTGNPRRTALPGEQIAAYIRVRSSAYFTVEHLQDAWKRPVHHNQRIEREALWYALNIANDCEWVLDSSERHRYVRPTTDDVVVRYDAEAAIRTIPSVLPFTRQERHVLTANQDKRANFLFEHGIGDSALGQLALAERWHDWLWTPPASPSERRASPGADAEMLALACTLLTNALGEVLAPSS